MPLTGALLLGLLWVVSGLAVAVVGRRAADGRLGRNALAGIRIRSTLRSDAAWRAGHAAARPASDAAGAVFVVTGLAATVVRPAPWFAGVVLAGTLGAVAVLLVGVRQGSGPRTAPTAPEAVGGAETGPPVTFRTGTGTHR